MQISETAYNLYFKCLGENPRTYGELCAYLPELSSEECEKTIRELINIGLLSQVGFKSDNFLSYFKTQPPLSQILDYFKNYSSHLDKMTKAIQDLTENTISSVIKNNKGVQLDTLFNELKEIIDDINEDTLLQKQEIEDIVIGMEGINIIKELFIDFKKSTITSVQKEFMEYVKTISTFKSKLIEKLQSLELKKREELILNLIEEEFKIYSEKVAKEFTGIFFTIIEDNYNSTKNAIEKSINTMFQYRNEFKMLLLGMISNFEKKMIEIFENIGKKRDKLEENLSDLEINISKKVNLIIDKFIVQVSTINNPITEVLNHYIEQINRREKLFEARVWTINSKAKLNEEITHIIKNSKERLTLIVPKIEEFLSIEQIQSLPQNLIIDIGSSDPSTNSRVKKILENKNLQFKQLQNKNIIISKSDQDYCVIGLIIEGSDGPLNNFIGFGSNFPPLVGILKKIIETFWSNGMISSIEPSKKLIDIPEAKQKIDQKQFSNVVKSQSPLPSFSRELKINLSSQISSSKQDNNLIMPVQPKVNNIAPQESSTKEMPKQKILSESNKIINQAFNILIKKLDAMKGYQFSKELDEVAALILEKKGFSVTLHNLRTCINKYKDHDTILDQIEKQQIKDAIESWRQHLLK